MAKTKTPKRPPKGWADGEYDQRTAALKKLPPRARDLARLRSGSDELLLSEFLVWNTLDLGAMPA